MSGNLPTFRGGCTGIHIRVVQSPGAVSIYVARPAGRVRRRRNLVDSRTAQAVQ